MTAVPPWLRRRPGGDTGFDRRLLAPIILGAILNPVNSTILAVSLVPIGMTFDAPPSATAWLITGLYLATAIGQPVVGRLVDAYGPRRLFLGATALVGVAGVLGTLAPTLGVLILARVILGLGTCAGYPAAMSLIRSEARRTGRESPAGVLTILAVSTQTIAIIGPPLGGLLIGLGGWRATLAVNIPLSLVAFTLGALRLPSATPRRSTTTTQHRSALDLHALLGNRPLLLTYLRTLLAYVVSYAFLYGYVQWLEDGHGLSPSAAGLLQLPLFATGIIVAASTGRRREIRGKLTAGAVSQLAGCALLLLLDPGSAIWLLVVVALVFGIPQGLNSLALQNSVYHQASSDTIGASAGLMRTFMYLGAILAAATQGALYGHRANTDGLHHLALVMVAVAAAFLLVTVFDRSLSTIIPRSHADVRPDDQPAADGAAGDGLPERNPQPAGQR